MATYATLTVPVQDIIGADFNASRASVWIEPNVPFVLADSIRVGGRREQVVNGVATFANLVTTDTADNPASFGYRVTITAPPKGAAARKDIVNLTTADFPFTATAVLTDISEAWDNIVLPVEWRSAFRDEMEALRDETEALIVSDLGTTDGQTRALIELESSQTAQALTATIATALVDDVAVRTAGTVGAAASTTIRFIDAAGARIRGNAKSLQKSTDNGATWTTFATLPETPSGVRQMDNGELLVGTSEAPGTVKAALYVSSGYAAGGTVTFTKKLEVSDFGQTMELAWGFGGGGTTYAVSEYDSKAPGSRSASQRAWITTNSGGTFTEIYDHGNGSLSSRHIHGVYADPHRPGTVWLTLGDYTGTSAGDRRIRVSRDNGATWADVSTAYQPTAIMVFPNAVAFGSDNAPNGVLVLSNPDAAPSAMRLSMGYRINTQTVITHVAERPFRAATREGYLTVLPFSSAVAGVSGVVLGSYDGTVWFEVWRDSNTSTAASQGPFTAFGPTRDGKLLVRGKDTAGVNYDAEVPINTLPGVASVAANLAAGIARLIPRRAYIAFNNQSSPFQTMVSNTEAAILLHTTAAATEDPGGLYTPASDGITVNRDAIVRIECSGGKPLTYTGRYDTILTVGGVELRRVSDMTLGMTLRVAAGQKVQVRAQPNGYNGALTGFRALILDAWETGA